jgi:hypothetical protein
MKGISMIKVMKYDEPKASPYTLDGVDVENCGDIDFIFNGVDGSHIHIEGKLKDFEELYNKVKTAASLFPQAPPEEEKF